MNNLKRLYFSPSNDVWLARIQRLERIREVCNKYSASKLDPNQIYVQYRFLRDNCKKTFSESVSQLSFSHNRHETIIIKLLEEIEDEQS